MSPKHSARRRAWATRAPAAGRRVAPRARLAPFAAAGAGLPRVSEALRHRRLRRLQRQLGFTRRAIGLWIEQFERTKSSLWALEEELAEETGEEPEEDPLYGEEYDTTSVDTGYETGSLEVEEVPADTGGVVTTTPASEAAQPETRVLFDIFDDLANEDFTDDFYPRVDAVNAALAERGEPSISRTAMHAHFDRYLHERIADGQISPPPRWSDEGQGAKTAKPKKVTEAVLFETFATLGEEDLTADKSYPLVGEVQARIPAIYEKPSQKEIRSAWDKWRKQQEQ